jgi:hypothetical protein
MNIICISWILTFTQEISAFYVIRRFIAMFVRARWIELITEENGKHKKRTYLWAILGMGGRQIFSISVRGTEYPKRLICPTTSNCSHI